MFLVYYLLSLLVYATVIGQEFRSDYNYFDQVGGWMKLHAVPATWHDAWLRCNLEGAILASPLNEGISSAMTSLMSTSMIIFTGIHASFSRGDYTSVEGVPLSTIPATRGQHELDNIKNGESCIAMKAYGTLFDTECDNVFRYICFKKYDQSMTTQNECGTLDNEYRLEAETGSCYKFHRTPRTWSRAYMACMAEGGHLAVINSQAEARILAKIFSAVPTSTIRILPTKHVLAHIGFHNWGEHGLWLTIHGQSLQDAGYKQWGGEGSEPNNATHTGGVGEFCGSISVSAELNDIWCDFALSFICEKDPKSLAVER